jgi:hypothetical protein
METLKSKAALFRERAEECEGLAAQISFAPARQQLMEICKRWRALAEQAEKHGW